MSVEFDEVCKRFGVPVVAPAPIDKVGVALDTLHLAPLNGLRHQPEAGTCGWFIWGGQEPSADPEFFQPVHVGHLWLAARQRCPTWVCLPATGSCSRRAKKTRGSTPRCCLRECQIAGVRPLGSSSERAERSGR